MGGSAVQPCVGRPGGCGSFGVAAGRARGRDQERPGGRRDRGSGTVWMLALMGLTWSVGAMGMTVGGARAARHRAYAGADLAALAAASHVVDGPSAACRLAARVARGSGTRLSRCVVRGRVSEVVVVADVGTLPVFGHLAATARARAGPEKAPVPCDPSGLCAPVRPDR